MASLVPHPHSHPTGPARWQQTLLLPPCPEACCCGTPRRRQGPQLEHTCPRAMSQSPNSASSVCRVRPGRAARESAAGRHSLPHRVREGGRCRPIPRWYSLGEGEGNRQRRVAVPEATGWGPCHNPLRASSAGTLRYHHDVPGTTLPVPGGGAGWAQPDRLLSGQSYSGPEGWGLWGEGLLDGLPLSASPLPPAWTKAGIEGQDWHFSQAPRLLRLRLALQGLGTLTLLWGLPGLPCAIHKDPGRHKEELTGWHQKDGAGFVGLIYLAGGNPVPLSLDPRGCL